MTGHSTQNSVHSAADWAWPPSYPQDTALPERSWWVAVLQEQGAMWGLSEGGGNRATWHVEAGSGSVRVARDLFRATTRDWGMSHVTADTELVISELLTNAVRHAPVPANRSEPQGLEVVAMRRNAQFVCAVRDHSDALPAPREPDFMAETGRGLHLVASFSRAWGVIPVYPRGKYVWALMT